MVKNQPKTRILLSSRANREQSSTRHVLSRKEQMSPAFTFIRRLEEVTLGPKATINNVSATGYSMIIPLVGTVEINERSIEVDRFLIIPNSKNLILKNPYTESNIHFLFLSAEVNYTQNPSVEPLLTADQNLFNELHSDSSTKISIGKFDGRHDFEFATSSNAKTLAYVIEGAFELQNCLLEKGDALEVTDTQSVEFEALSNDAILLLIEHNAIVS